MVDGLADTIVFAGATGDLGTRIIEALARRGAEVRTLVRSGTPAAKLATVRDAGGRPVEIDFANASRLGAACAGADCIVFALSGLAPTILELQGRLLDAAVAAGVPRFIPSDFSLDFARTTPGENRNLDLRRTMARLD